MKRGRYNILLPEIYGSIIMKFNVYQNDCDVMFIYFEGEYIPVIRYSRYRSGWLWCFKYDTINGKRNMSIISCKY